MGEYFSELGEVLARYDFVGAIGTNLRLALFAAIGALVIGTVLALMRISPFGSLQWAGRTYVDILRNTPLTAIIVFGVLALWPKLGVQFSPSILTNLFWIAVLGLSVYHAAFVCEAIRSGVNTVPLGQAEAARAIGLGFLPSARLIILPQAFRGAVAPLGNTLIALIKNTTVAAAGSISEASATMKVAIEFSPDKLVAIFLAFALGFVVIIVPIGMLTTWLSRRLAVSR